MRVLLVDDDFYVLESLRRMLYDFNFDEVVETRSYRAALSHAMSPFELAIIDIEIPLELGHIVDSDEHRGLGIELASELKKAQPDLHLIFNSSHANRRNYIDPLLARFGSGIGYMLKQKASSQQLARALDIVGNGGIFIDTDIKPTLLKPPAQALLNSFDVNERESIWYAYERLPSLTSLEMETARQLARDFTWEQIAQAHHVTVEAVQSRLKSIRYKLLTPESQKHFTALLTKALLLYDLQNQPRRKESR